MISIHHKSKLPKTLVWPIGAQAISLALTDSPRFTELELTFSDSPVIFKSEFQRLLRESLPYTVLEAEYRPKSKPGYFGSNWEVERGWYEPKWRLRVNPVLPSLQPTVGLLLQEQGLLAVADWLKSSLQTGWDLRYHRIELVFAPTSGTLTSRLTDGA